MQKRASMDVTHNPTSRQAKMQKQAEERRLAESARQQALAKKREQAKTTRERFASIMDAFGSMKMDTTRISGIVKNKAAPGRNASSAARASSSRQTLRRSATGATRASSSKRKPTRLFNMDTDEGVALTKNELREIQKAIKDAPKAATNYAIDQLGRDADQYFGTNHGVVNAQLAHPDPAIETPVYIKPNNLTRKTVLPQAFHSLPHQLKKVTIDDKQGKAEGRRRRKRTRGRNPNKNNHKNTYKQLPFVRRFRLRY